MIVLVPIFPIYRDEFVEVKLPKTGGSHISTGNIYIKYQLQLTLPPRTLYKDFLCQSKLIFKESCQVFILSCIAIILPTGSIGVLRIVELRLLNLGRSKSSGECLISFQLGTRIKSSVTNPTSGIGSKINRNTLRN